MERSDNDYGMPIPDEAMGLRVLVIDSNWASLMHTTSLLEDATFRVTTTQHPHEAISMMEERGDEFDLVIAAMQMQGTDCFTFLRTLKTLSNIPVVLTSCEMYSQLTVKILKHGVSEYFELPMRSVDVRSLWQHVFSKRNRKNAADVGIAGKEMHQDDNSNQLIRDCKGKEICTESQFAEKCLSDEGTESKESEQEIRKTQRSYGDKEIEQQYHKRKGFNNDDKNDYETESDQNHPPFQKRKRSCDANDQDNDADDEETENDVFKSNPQVAEKKNNKADENLSMWNPKLQPMFVDTTVNNKGKEIATTTQYEIENADTMLVSQNAGHTNSKSIPKGKKGRKKIKGVPKAKYAGIEIKSVPNAWYAGNEIQSVPTERYARHVFQNFSYSRCARNQILSVPNLNTVNTVSGAEKGQPGASSLNFQPGSQFPGTLQLREIINQNRRINGESFIKNSLLLNNSGKMTVNEIADRQPNHGRINEIRQAYSTHTQQGNGSYIQSYGYNGASCSNMGYYTQANAPAGKSPYQVQPLENDVAPMQQISNNLQMGTTRLFPAANLPYPESNCIKMIASESLENLSCPNNNYSNMLASNSMENLPYSENNINNVLTHITLADQAIQPTNSLSGNDLQNSRVVHYSGEETINNVGVNNMQLPTEDDLIFEEIIAELRDDFTDNDLRSIGFDTVTDL